MSPLDGHAGISLVSMRTRRQKTQRTTKMSELMVYGGVRLVTGGAVCITAEINSEEDVDSNSPFRGVLTRAPSTFPGSYSLSTRAPLGVSQLKKEEIGSALQRSRSGPQVRHWKHE